MLSLVEHHAYYKYLQKLVLLSEFAHRDDQ